MYKVQYNMLKDLENASLTEIFDPANKADEVKKEDEVIEEVIEETAPEADPVQEVVDNETPDQEPKEETTPDVKDNDVPNNEGDDNDVLDAVLKDLDADFAKKVEEKTQEMQDTDDPEKEEELSQEIKDLIDEHVKDRDAAIAKSEKALTIAGESEAKAKRLETELMAAQVENGIVSSNATLKSLIGYMATIDNPGSKAKVETALKSLLKEYTGVDVEELKRKAKTVDQEAASPKAASPSVPSTIKTGGGDSLSNIFS